MTRGLYSRLTADEIATVRESWDRYQAAKRERQELLRQLRISRSHWCRIGEGIAGKKPRAEA